MIYPVDSVIQRFNNRGQSLIGVRYLQPGPGHYLSPGEEEGGWGGGFFGNHLIFRRTKGGSVVTENPKGEIFENFERIQRGTTQICLENEDTWVIAKVIKSY